MKLGGVFVVVIAPELTSPNYAAQLADMAQITDLA